MKLSRSLTAFFQDSYQMSASQGLLSWSKDQFAFFDFSVFHKKPSLLYKRYRPNSSGGRYLDFFFCSNQSLSLKQFVKLRETSACAIKICSCSLNCDLRSSAIPVFAKCVVGNHGCWSPEWRFTWLSFHPKKIRLRMKAKANGPEGPFCAPDLASQEWLPLPLPLFTATLQPLADSSEISPTTNNYLEDGYNKNISFQIS